MSWWFWPANPPSSAQSPPTQVEEQINSVICEVTDDIQNNDNIRKSSISGVKVEIGTNSKTSEMKESKNRTSSRKIKPSMTRQKSRERKESIISQETAVPLNAPSKVPETAKNEEQQKLLTDENNQKSSPESNDQNASDNTMAKVCSCQDSSLTSHARYFISHLVILFLVYLSAYFGLSFAWTLVCLVIYTIQQVHRLRSVKRMYIGREIGLNEQLIIEKTLVDLPNWVYFPDSERVEWLNKVTNI